jgi:hypothetical protein
MTYSGARFAIRQPNIIRGEILLSFLVFITSGCCWSNAGAELWRIVHEN